MYIQKNGKMYLWVCVFIAAVIATVAVVVVIVAAAVVKPDEPGGEADDEAGDLIDLVDEELDLVHLRLVGVLSQSVDHFAACQLVGLHALPTKEVKSNITHHPVILMLLPLRQHQQAVATL